MAKFVIAYLSLFEGEMKMEVVYAKSKYEALKAYLDYEDLPSTLDGIYDYANQCDFHIEALEILPEKKPAGFSPLYQATIQ